MIESSVDVFLNVKPPEAYANINVCSKTSQMISSRLMSVNQSRDETNIIHKLLKLN